MTNRPTFNSWITCPKPNPQAKLRLFCFPYAGGGAAIFRRWSASLPPTIEVCPVEFPGRGRQIKLPPFTRLEPLLDAIAQVIIPFLDKQFAFFGHSMGALVSFELIRLLRSQYNLIPSHFFVAARRAPQLTFTKTPSHTLSDSEFLELINNFNGTPQIVLETPEMMQLFLPILRADFAVLETYVYHHEPPLQCPITVFGGLQDTEITYEELQAWEKQAGANFSLQMLPGNHFFLPDPTVLIQGIMGQMQL